MVLGCSGLIMCGVLVVLYDFRLFWGVSEEVLCGSRLS